MTAKEQKAFMELGKTLGYEGEDLRQYVAHCIEAERAQKEADRALREKRQLLLPKTKRRKPKSKLRQKKQKLKLKR